MEDKFADVTKLDLVGAPDGRLSIQRSLDRLEKVASSKLQNFSKGTHQVLPLEGIKPGTTTSWNLQNFSKGTHQVLPLEGIKPGTTTAWLKSGFAEKHLVDTMWTMSQRQVLAAGKASSILCHIRQGITSRVRDIILPLSYPAGPYLLPVLALQDKAGSDIVEQAQQMAMRVISTV
ncbi:hypothetical protein DUI87_15763 [Hirundo rustica rustica]|uniref:Uncharacterized protein n=1 Tax=Hirundo rustica rustica TaxID=333673 RepID=A0A3M0JZF3_HIRRU|nr:hypothetical protein DUI87_15763 [Hirundo rustica rustica]